MANMLSASRVDAELSEHLAFYVVAPRSQTDAGSSEIWSASQTYARKVSARVRGQSNKGWLRSPSRGEEPRRSHSL